MTCPLPLYRLADHVGEINAAVEWASFQAEYGMSQEEWLQDNQSDAQDMLDRWWTNLPATEQREWITRYRAEVVEHIEDLQRTLEMLDTL